MEEVVEQRLRALLAEPIEKLRSLPEYAGEELVLDGKKIAVATYHETLENGSHRIIVQASRQRWGGIVAKVIASGYELPNTGGPRKLRPEELYTYT